MSCSNLCGASRACFPEARRPAQSRSAPRPGRCVLRAWSRRLRRNRRQAPGPTAPIPPVLCANAPSTHETRDSVANRPSKSRPGATREAPDRQVQARSAHARSPGPARPGPCKARPVRAVGEDGLLAAGKKFPDLLGRKAEALRQVRQAVGNGLAVLADQGEDGHHQLLVGRKRHGVRPGRFRPGLSRAPPAPWPRYLRR